MPKKLDSSIIGMHEKFLIYGGVGTGKTFATGTMPGRVYYLVVGGANELKTLLSKTFREAYPEKEDMFTYDYVTEKRGARGVMEEAEAFDIAGDMIDEALERDRQGDMPFDSLVLDGATGLRMAAMYKSIEISYAMAGQKDKTALKRLRDEGILIPGDNDYGGEQSLIWQLVNYCFELPKHFCLVTHEWHQTKADRATRIEQILAVKPAFTGKQRDDIPTLFDNVWRFTTTGGKDSVMYEAQTVKDEKVDAKTRMGGILPVLWRNPDFTEAIELFREAVPNPKKE